MKASRAEIDELVEIFVKPHHKISHYLKKGWLQLDDLNLFLKQMKEEIYYNDCCGFFNPVVDVWFNYYEDGKVHFSIPNKFEGKRICTYELFCKRVWNYFNGSKVQKNELIEQLSLF